MSEGYHCLQETHIGKEVNKLRKTDGEVGKTAKLLVRSWKKLLADVTSPREKREGEEEGRQEEEEVRERRRKGKHKAKKGSEEERNKGQLELHCSSSSHDPSPSLLAPPTTSSRERACESLFDHVTPCEIT